MSTRQDGVGPPPVWAGEPLVVPRSHHLVRATLPVSASGVGILVASLTMQGRDVVIGVALAGVFLVTGVALALLVRRSELVVSTDGRLRVRMLRAQPEVGLSHASAITRRIGIMRVTVDGDPVAGRATVAVPLAWWEHEEAVAQILRDTARLSGCAVEPAAALVLGIPARCEAGQELPPRLPTAQAVVVLAVVAATTAAAVIHLAGAVLR